MIATLLALVRRPPAPRHDGLVIAIGEHDRALLCSCGAMFRVRRGEAPEDCPEWHAHCAIVHLHRMSEARR